VLEDEQIRSTLTRQGAPNLFIFKHEIMYIAEDGAKRK
jgi:hypothetical protein